MKSTMFTFGADILGEGAAEVVAIQRDLGIDRLALSANYHDARDVWPHNPLGHVYRHEGDITWFRPEWSLYTTGLKPTAARETTERDIMRETTDAAAQAGMPVDAWTIFHHNSRLAQADPSCATRNALGDVSPTDLCPAHPRVTQYFIELVTDICRYPVERVLLESLHYRTFEHGEHHERYFVRIDPWARRLLSLCFCSYCTAMGVDAGVDVERLRHLIVQELESVWQETAPKQAVDPASELNLLVAAFQHVRRALVLDRVRAVADQVTSLGRECVFIDHAGAMPAVSAGATADMSVAELGEIIAVDAAGISAALGNLAVLGYTHDDAVLDTWVRQYRAAQRDDAWLMVVVRALAADTRDAAHLRARLDLLAGRGVAEVGFYAYGATTRPRLEWLRQALAHQV